MRVLIGYNGSAAATAALDDLELAGFPDGTEALILTVSESWVHPTTMAEASSIAEPGKAALSRTFPTWTTASEAVSGSPAHEILARAESFHPDVIIVGEPHHAAEPGHIFLGHTSQTILAKADCTVRIARSRENATPNTSPRLLVGFDGSATARNAVDMISRRKWPDGTTVRLLAVADSSMLSSIGRFTPQMNNAAAEARFATQWAETLAAKRLTELTAAGLSASVDIQFGHPMETIVKDAERWMADAIFVGPHSAPNSFERYLMGSVSSGVAARANCTVEVVRG